jgi:hypothetical protein
MNAVVMGSTALKPADPPLFRRCYPAVLAAVICCFVTVLGRVASAKNGYESID